MYFLKESGNHGIQIATSDQAHMGSHSAQNSTPGFVFFIILQYSFIILHYSFIILDCSSLFIHYSSLFIHYSFIFLHYSFIILDCSSLFIHYSSLFIHYSFIFLHYFLVICFISRYIAPPFLCAIAKVCGLLFQCPFPTFLIYIIFDYPFVFISWY